MGFVLLFNHYGVGKIGEMDGRGGGNSQVNSHDQKLSHHGPLL